MSEETGQTSEPQEPPEGKPEPQAEPSKPRSIDEMLSGLDEDARKAVTGQLEKARKEAADYRTKLREAEPLAKKAREAEEAQKTAEQKAQDAATAAEKRANELVARTVRAEVKALAADTFADADDAPMFLELSKYADAEGTIDSEAIKTDLADVLKRKPHLGKAPEGPRSPAPDKSQGSSAKGGVSVDQRIEDAQSKGDWRTALSLQNSKLANSASK